MKQNTLKSIAVVSLVILLITISASDILAQCPMCRISAESNLANGGTAGNGLNKGILFLLSLPYLLIGTLGYVWWKNKKKASSESLEK